MMLLHMNGDNGQTVLNGLWSGSGSQRNKKVITKYKKLLTNKQECGNKHRGLNMTVQELINELNKVEDKSKVVRFDYNIKLIEGLEENIYFVDIY